MSRHDARITAMQLAFQKDFGQDDQRGLEFTVENAKLNNKDKDYAWALFENIMAEKNEIDKILEDHSKSWSLERLGFVEKNILRLAIYEMLMDKEVPAKVAINEALEIAKLYCEEGAAPFINGILDSILKNEGEKQPYKENIKNKSGYK